MPQIKSDTATDEEY